MNSNTKTCNQCNEEKLATTEFFHKMVNAKDGLRAICKVCRKVSTKVYRDTNVDKIKGYEASHRTQKAAYNKLYRTNNRDRVRALDAKWRQNNPEKVKLSRAKTQQKHGAKYIRRSIERRRESPQLRIACSLRNRVRKVLVGINKAAATFDLLGCDIQTFMCHLSSLFQTGMTFNNYGAWHVDHIRPCASFDLSDPDQQRECFHYTNLQPLWAEDNLKKGAS